MQTIYKKVFREIACYKSRTILTLVGIVIGVFSIGFILSSYGILNREMNRNFMDTNPSSMVIKVSNLDQEGMDYLSSFLPELKLEARKRIQARINRDNGTYGTIYLYGIENFNDIKIDCFTLEKGVWPNDLSEMVIERDSLTLLPNIEKGYDEEVSILIPGGKEKTIKLCGKVHAPGLSPASMEKYSYGFMTLEGLQALGYKGWYDEVHIICEAQRFNRQELQSIASQLQQELIKKGYEVDEVRVPEPGKHPHHDQLESFIFLLQAFTAIALLIACMITTSLISAIMFTQKRQMAIMKTIGATTWDIAKSYILYVLVISVVAELIGLPLAYFVGGKYAEFAAATLNFKIASYRIPLWMIVLQIIIGIGTSLLTALYPICKNARLTIKVGLTNQEEYKQSKKASIHYQSRKEGLLHKLTICMMIPLQNIFRRKTRTMLVVMALASGGVIFLAAQNIVVSIAQTVNQSNTQFGYYFDIKLEGNYLEDEISSAIGNISEVSGYRLYESSEVTLIKDERQSGAYKLKALPSESETLKVIEMYKEKGIDHPILINQSILEEETDLKIGQEVTLKIQGQVGSVTIAGIVNEMPPLPYMYMTLEDYKRLFRDKGEQNIQVYLREGVTYTSQKQLEIAAKIETELGRRNIHIAENWNIYLLRQAFAEHLKIIINFLSIVATLAIMVGGVSMVSIIGMNVTERKRELGILEAIGASKGTMIRMILVEVIAMGGLGWLVGVIIAYPISVLVGNYFGQIFIHTNLQNVVSFSGMIIWLGLALGTAIISGIIAINQVIQAPLRDRLDYE